MRFLVDAQLPPRLADWLDAQGHEARHVADAISATAEDRVIVAFAAKTEAVIVTKDTDFLTLSTDQQPPLLFVVCGNRPNRVLFELFERQFPAALAKLQRGAEIVEIGWA